MAQILDLYSWNVNGLRAVHKKGFMAWLEKAQPDILCLQETRVEKADLPAEIAQLAGYTGYWNPCQIKKGYSGTALLTRTEPIDIQFGLGIPRFDQEGRTIVARYPSFTLINSYFPNGGRDHSRVPFKMEFYDAFLDKCAQLGEQGQPVIFCGDVNTAHREIDLAHPQANRNTTGFLPEERAWIDRVIQAGYVDVFRHLHPDLGGQYTWWSMPTRSRERNVGWRIDYFFVERRLLDRVAGAHIWPEAPGSDHCPVSLQLHI